MLPSFLEEAEPVIVHDVFDVFWGIAFFAEQVGKFLEVGYGLEVVGALFAAEGTVEVGANADVERVAGELADVVEVVDERFEVAVHDVWSGLSAYPVGYHHPSVEGPTDDGTAVDECFDLFVAELAVVVNQGADVVVAGPYGSVEKIECFPEAIVAEVGGIEDYVEPLHFTEQGFAVGAYGTLGVGALGVTAGAIVRRTYGTQSITPGFFYVGKVDQGIGAFEAEDITNGFFYIGSVIRIFIGGIHGIVVGRITVP